MEAEAEAEKVVSPEQMEEENAALAAAEQAAAKEEVEEAQEPPQKKTKYEPIPTKFTLGIALETAGIPKIMQKIIVAMRDDPCSLDWNSSLVRGVEKALIFKLDLKMKFKQRGPPGPKDGGPKKWGGQAWRKQGNRWGNRGGKNKDFYTWLYTRK